MFVKIDLNSNEPIYIQIKNEIIKAIAEGFLKNGDVLPPVRKLAENLGINMHTVNKAYNLLKENGFINLNRKKGAVVSYRSNNFGEKDFAKLKNLLKPILTEYYCKGFGRKHFVSIVEEIISELSKHN